MGSRDGAKGVQLAEKNESWSKRCWVDIPEL